jgi:hypothetical protein
VHLPLCAPCVQSLRYAADTRSAPKTSYRRKTCLRKTLRYRDAMGVIESRLPGGNGVQGVAGSNPAVPITSAKARQRVMRCGLFAL